MLVKELMNRSGVPNFGVARMFIEDGLTEMCVHAEPWIKETTISLFETRRFYRFPDEIVGIKDILIRNHMNNKGEYRSIPRLINPPKIKDVQGGVRGNASSDSETAGDMSFSDLNHSLMGTQQGPTGGIDDRDDKAREYAYFMMGDKIGIVEKDIHQSSSGDIVNDTDAYQKASYQWVSPQADQSGSVRIRYTYIPVYNTNTSTGNADDNETNRAFLGTITGMNPTATGQTHSMNLYSSFPLGGSPVAMNLTSNEWFTNGSLDAGRHILVENAGNYTGLWEITDKSTGGAITTAQLKVKVSQNRDPQSVDNRGDAINEIVLGYNRATPIIHLDTDCLYSEQEDFYLPIKPYLALALVDYMKSRAAQEVGEHKLKEYLEKQFRAKLEKSETAMTSGPRMIAPGPFAIK